MTCNVPNRRAARSRLWVFALMAGLVATALPAQAALKPETKAAYQQYIAEVGAKASAQAHAAAGFLWIDRDGARQQSVRRGETVTQKVKSFSVPDGMVQHWIGGVFLPGTTLAAVAKADQDYAHYANFYGPDISQVKVLSHDGNHYVVAYRITKKKVLTAVLDTVQAIDYSPVGAQRLTVQSQSKSVRQVDDAGTPSEHALPEGEGSGFLWAMNSYWRMEERDGGVYMECEAITLSRDVPLGLGSMINPILQSFAEESLKKTLQQKRQAVASRR